MLSFLYPFSYFASMLGLIMWFYFRDNRSWGRTMRNLFFASLGVYLLALLLAPGLLPFKLFTLFRDLLVMGVIAQFFRFFRDNKLVFFIMLVVLVATFQFKYKSVLQYTFPTNSTVSEQWDEQWELLVEISDGHQLTELQDVLTKYQLDAEPAFFLTQTDRTDLDDYVAINIPPTRAHEWETIESAFVESGLVDWVEINEQMMLKPIETTRRRPSPNNPYGLNDPHLDKLWGFEAMGVDQLYKVLEQQQIQPQRPAKIFILDTGVDAKHEDLRGRYFSTERQGDRDRNRHGTHCAGIAAAVSDNGLGIASFAPKDGFVKVSSIKVLGDEGMGTQRRIINGILKAADNGADVISLSLGAPSKQKRQRAYAKAVKYANSRGAIVVVAAGNSNMNAKDYTPANAPGVISVTALDTLQQRASFSNYVQDIKMGIAAPGVAIYSTIPGNDYAFLNGTSMATPYVAGLLGLMKSIRPELTTKQAYDILNSTGKPTSSGVETGPLIQPAAAVTALLQLN